MNALSFRNLVLAIGLVLVAGVATPNATAQDGEPALPAADKPSPHVRLNRSRVWRAHADIIVRPRFVNSIETLGADQAKYGTSVSAVSTLTFAVPAFTAYAIEAGGTEPEPEQVITGFRTRKLQVNDIVRPFDPEYDAETGMIEWTVLPASGQSRLAVGELRLDVEWDYTPITIQVNEATASAVDWPSGAWPARAARQLVPEALIDFGPRGDYDTKALERMFKSWTNGKPATSVKPYALAKWFAGQLTGSFRARGDASAVGDPEFMTLSGYKPEPLDELMRRGLASDMELALLLTWFYREAGLPARFVAWYNGQAARGQGEGQGLFERESGVGAFVYGVEFALYDEASESLAWIPVFPGEIRRKTSRLPRNYMDRPLEYFGNHPDMDGLIPVARFAQAPTFPFLGGAPQGRVGRGNNNKLGRVVGLSYEPMDDSDGVTTILNFRARPASVRGN
ncbi:MAG: hypothetical protein AAGG07_05560 [Planctomycetota bacterium]